MSSSSDPRSRYKPAPGEVPTSPGVYRFLDAHGRALYVGKAKNLRSRLANYFAALETLNPRIQRMLTLAKALDWTVVGTDTEALVLEHTWINEFEPPFNVQFRDDKSYPYIAITLGSEAPRVVITRNRSIKGARYFGPFPKVWAVREIAALLQQAFPIRTCNDANYQRAMKSGVACLASQINRCTGPCSHRVTFEEHNRNVQAVVAFLSGRDKEQLALLQTHMREASANQNYELAAKFRDQIAAAEHILEANTMVLRDSVNADAFALVSDELAACVHQFIIRDGRIRGERSWIVDADFGDTESSLISNLLQSVYLESSEIPPEIMCDPMPEDIGLLSEVFESQAGRKIRLTAPSRGEKHNVMLRASQNARENLNRYKLKRAADIVTRTDALAQLQLALHLEEVPLRIECVDISHLSGTQIVGSVVTFEDAIPAKSGYRQYKIESSRDDTDSIYQLLTRRFARDDEQAEVTPQRRPIPDLLLVDGGQPQVEAAARALRDAGRDSIAVCGVAKRLEELWLAGEDFPVILPRNSEALFIVQRIRDEAHRFAITLQRKQRSQGIKSVLGEIEGLGEKRISNLLRHFGSVARIRSAKLEEIEMVSGIGPELAHLIHLKLNS